MHCKTQIKSSSKGMISKNKKLSFCNKCESRVSLSLEDKRKMWEEKAMLDKLVDEIDESSDSLFQV